MEETVSYHFAAVKQRRENRNEIEYHLTLRQQPKQSRMCGVGEKADRRPIDPPPIVQLKVIDSKLSPTEKNNFLQNPYYFMYASLMAGDLDEEIHLLRDGRTRSTTGSVVSSLYHLKDIDNTDAGFFVFPDLSVRMEGDYRLKLSLFEIIGKEVFHCKSIISSVFFVYSAKKFPGMEESTFLSRSFADQGLKIRIRKELRQRRKVRTYESEEKSVSGSENGKRAKIAEEDTQTHYAPYSTSSSSSSHGHSTPNKHPDTIQFEHYNNQRWSPIITSNNNSNNDRRGYFLHSDRNAYHNHPYQIEQTAHSSAYTTTSYLSPIKVDRVNQHNIPTNSSSLDYPFYSSYPSN